jgi:hypothetical protein
MLQHGSVNDTASLVVHCLLSDSEATKTGEQSSLLIAWPLAHDNGTLRSLSSFYSAVTEPLFISGESAQDLRTLIRFIDKESSWQQMQLGHIDEPSLTSTCIAQYFSIQKACSQTDNYYLDDLSGSAKNWEKNTKKVTDNSALISSFESYYSQRPSQLRNTIKRRGKKLSQAHDVEIKIITTEADFPTGFNAYKDIYQQSWKGDEFSFAFIEQVCRAAISEDKLRLGLLLVDGEPAAAQLWFLQRGNNSAGIEYHNASIFKLAYSPKYQQFSVGSILSKALTEHVLNKDSVTSIEFGMGSEPYKKDWLPKKRLRVCYQVFNQRTLYGNLLALRHFYLPKVVQFFRRLVNKK